MNKSQIRLLSSVVFYLCWVGNASSQFPQLEQSKEYWQRKEFMSWKRNYAALVAEGFMTEQKEIIVYYGKKLLDTSGDESWSELFKAESKNPVFKQKSKEFRDEVQAMMNGMAQKDPDAAMSAFTRSLHRCYECHTQVRSGGRSRLAQ